MTQIPRDRLRELLDAVLDDEATNDVGPTLDDMARKACTSPFHFSRQLRAGAGEPPVAMRRRVCLERASWRLRQGESVTEVALTEGYDSVAGFSRAYSRAFGHPPSATTSGSDHRLPAPNGIHFHPPAALWVDSVVRQASPMPLLSRLLHHDHDDLSELLELAREVSAAELDRVALPGHVVLSWDGPEETLATVLNNLVCSKEVWLAAIDGAVMPSRGANDLASITLRWNEIGPRWISAVQRINDEGRWADTLIDALCEPPESFELGSVILHVITFSTHRRLVARQLLRSVLGTERVSHGDPIEWIRGRP